MKVFSMEKILLQHDVLGYQIDAYFPEHKLAIEIDELGHNDKDIDKETSRENKIKKNNSVNLLELIQIKKTMTFLLKLVKYIIT